MRVERLIVSPMGKTRLVDVDLRAAEPKSRRKLAACKFSVTTLQRLDGLRQSNLYR